MPYCCRLWQSQPHEETSGRIRFSGKQRKTSLETKTNCITITRRRITSATSLMGQNVIARLNQPKVRTMSRKQLWKPWCGLLVLLFIPLTGRSDVVQDWDAIMQATVSSQPPFPRARFAAITQTCRIRGGQRNHTTIQAVPRNDNRTRDASPEAAAAARTTARARSNSFYPLPRIPGFGN